MMDSEMNHPLATENYDDESDQMQTLTLDDDDGGGGGGVSSSGSNSYTNYSTVENPPVSDPLLFPSRSNPSLDSPSYADVISTPFHESNGNGEISAEVAVSSPRSEYLKISVSNPRKEFDSSSSIVPGANTYVTYLITTSTSLAVYGGSSFSVRRRFRDVVALANRLSEGYRGFFVPPRPDKSVVEGQVMQKQDFVEQRRMELEKYLRRLAKHPVIKKCEELRVFLTVEGRMPFPASSDAASRTMLGESRTSGIEPQEPAKGGRDMLRFFRELKQSVVNDWVNFRPYVEEEDREFLEKKERLWILEQKLTGASDQAESLVKAQQDMGDAMGELGLAFIKLTKFENEQAVSNTQRLRAADMKCVATASVKSSRLYRELNAHTVKHFETLHEYMGTMLAVHNAFSDRSSALSTVQSLVSELSSLRSRADKLETSASKTFGDRSKMRKLDDLKDAIKTTEDAKNSAIKEYGKIKENNRSEILRMERERQVDFVEMLKGFVINQVAYNEKIGNEWARVVEETRKEST